MIGSVVNYRYEILEKVGDGNFFAVYKARDKVLNRLVAVKTLDPKSAENSEFAQRLCAEIQAASKLSHPNITRTYECDRQDNVWYVVTDYVRGINLKERIKRIAPLQTSAAVDIAIAVCEALDCAHKQGFVHGDVRPQNILVSSEGEVKLGDFGVAAALAAFPAVHAASMFRSVHYTPPEVAEGKPPQPASDIYALGVVLYEMLTGSVPFDAENPIGIAMKHAKEPVRPPHELNAGVPKALEAIVMKALEKSPSDRYATAREMAADLMEVRDALRMGRAAPKTLTEERAPSDAAVEEVRPSGLLGNAFKSLMLMAVVMVVVAAAFFLWSQLTIPPEVVVPDLVGKTLEQATRIADHVGVQLVEVDERYNDRFPEGEIILTSPEAGTRVRKGRQVKVWISKGSRYALTPDVTELTEVSAREAILKADLTVGEVGKVYDDKIPDGSVVRQFPKPGTRQERGSPVNLMVSMGPKPPPEPSDFGEELPPDQAGRREFDVQFTVPEGSPDPSEVKIVVIDSMGRSTVYEEDRRPGDLVKTAVYGYGRRVEIRVYLNGEEVSRRVQ